MFPRGLSSIILSSVLLCATSSGAVSERDFLALGDGLLTFDDVNNREWLDLSLTILEQFQGNNLESILASVFAETEPNGMFEGFIFATGSDVEALAISAGIDTASEDFGKNEVPTKNILELLGVTYPRTPDRFLSQGFVDGTVVSVFGNSRAIASFSIRDENNGGPRSIAGFRVGAGADAAGLAATGVFLFRYVVPEPNSLLLLLLATTCSFLSRTHRTATAN